MHKNEITELKQIDIWNCSIIDDVYNAKDNIKIVDYNNDTGRCYIFFSSHNLYYPNTEEEFIRKVVEGDRFEWNRLATGKSSHIKADRIIFARDVYKQFYIAGVNHIVNSSDKLVDLLGELCKEYREVITVGSSAGGNIAMLVALKLSASRCICFAGQTLINDVNSSFKEHIIKKTDVHVDSMDILAQLENNKDCKIFYFYPAYNEGDTYQYDRISGCSNVYGFAFAQTNHAASMMDENKGFAISWDEIYLLKLYEHYHGKVINMYEFFFRTVPIIYWFRCAIIEFRKYIYRHFGKR